MPRSSERIYNIIDMNIMPINVHAMMRNIPLANIYNYSFTFDRMACMMYGLTYNEFFFPEDFRNSNDEFTYGRSGNYSRIFFKYGNCMLC